MIRKTITKKSIVCLFMLLNVLLVKSQNYSFISHQLYTSDDDKYLPANVQNDSAKVCIDEVNQEIELSLYNREVERWMTYPLVISYKIDFGVKTKLGSFYVCTNNVNQICGVCFCNTDEGSFIDLHNFHVGEKALSCWLKIEKE